MKIVSLKLKNYRLFESLEITDIPPFCVFIGANGTGKSTLFDIFGFLRDALKNNIRQALQVRGGFKEVVTRGKEQEDIDIELQFRMKVVDKEGKKKMRRIIALADGETLMPVWLTDKQDVILKVKEHCILTIEPFK